MTLRKTGGADMHCGDGGVGFLGRVVRGVAAVAEVARCGCFGLEAPTALAERFLCEVVGGFGGVAG